MLWLVNEVTIRHPKEGVRRLSLFIATLGAIAGSFGAMPLLRDLQWHRWSFQYFQQQCREHPNAKIRL